MTIDEALRWAKSRLDEPSEAYYLLCDLLTKPRSYLYTWPDEPLEQKQKDAFLDAVQRRAKGEPVAYILGKKAFWTFTLETSAATLIPRPETELLVEAALRVANDDAALALCDLGTGTGAIALAVATERPSWRVTGVDKIAGAVELARKNAKQLAISNVAFTQSDWFSQLNGRKFNIIVSNPPYVEDDSPYLAQGDLRFEPKSALTSGPDGLDDIRRITALAKDYLLPGGWLMFEHGYQQHPDVAAIMEKSDFIDIRALEDLNRYERITIAKLNMDSDQKVDKNP